VRISVLNQYIVIIQLLYILQVMYYILLVINYMQYVTLLCIVGHISNMSSKIICEHFRYNYVILASIFYIISFM